MLGSFDTAAKSPVSTSEATVYQSALIIALSTTATVNFNTSRPLGTMGMTGSTSSGITTTCASKEETVDRERSLRVASDADLEIGVTDESIPCVAVLPPVLEATPAVSEWRFRGPMAVGVEAMSNARVARWEMVSS